MDWLRQHDINVTDGDPPRQANGGTEPRPKAKQIVEVFDYVDEGGDLLFQVVRYEPKAFRQRRPDPSKPAGFDWSVKGVRPVPYRLPDLLEALSNESLVLIVEGERKVDLLRKWNVAATCCAGGAQKWLTEHSSYMKGTDVVILPDNDEAGRNHAAKAAASGGKGKAAHGLPQRHEHHSYYRARIEGMAAPRPRPGGRMQNHAARNHVVTSRASVGLPNFSYWTIRLRLSPASPLIERWKATRRHCGCA